MTRFLSRKMDGELQGKLSPAEQWILKKLGPPPKGPWKPS